METSLIVIPLFKIFAEKFGGENKVTFKSLGFNTVENFINKSFRFKSSQTSGAGTMSCKSLFL